MTIAVFDFDGTIISRDSLPDFMIRTCGWYAFCLRLPLIVTLKLASLAGIISTHRAKEQIFSSFFKGMKQEQFDDACRKYAKHIPDIVFPEALITIEKHLERKEEILIISASVPGWIRPWAETVGIRQVEGTEPEVRNGILTGRFATPNCKGREKVNRLRKRYPCFDTETLYVYGDSSGDKEILALADIPHYKPFRKK